MLQMIGMVEMYKYMNTRQILQIKVNVEVELMLKWLWRRFNPIK